MILLSLAPIAIYLIVLRAFDAFSMVRWKTMLAWMAWGMMSAFLTLGVVEVAHATNHTWTAPWVSPILEETLKVLPLFFFIWCRRVVFTAESQLYGQAAGGGFALVENVLYLQHFPNMGVANALVRGLGTGLLHMGCTALLATLTLLWVQHYRRSLLPTFPLLLLPSVGIHTFYNATSLSPMHVMIAMIVLFFLAFHLVGEIGERTVIRWLDVSLNDDVNLITALRQGKLAETKAGEYLSQLRDRFDPLVFFDMCVYVQLYLELLIEAKGRVMLHDAGIRLDETEEQKADRQARLSELDAIAKRIPRLGMQMLRPLIHATDQDRWVLRQE